MLYTAVRVAELAAPSVRNPPNREQSQWIVRQAFLAYQRVESRMMVFVDPELELTYFCPGLEAPQPQP